MTAKKILALILMAVMLVSCTACTTEIVIELGEIPAASNSTNVNANANTNTPTPTPDTNQGTATETPSQPSADETPTASNTETPTTQGNQTESTPSTGAPSTKAEIVKYYCDAYNKISEASKVIKTYDYTSNYNNIVNVNNNDTLKGIAQTLMTQFMVETTDPVDSSHDALPPVGSTSINISESLIGNATCEDKGDHYIVTLYSTGTDDNYEVDSQPGTGSVGSFGPLLRTEDVSGAAGSLIKFEGLASLYATATVTAKIDKATGHITELEYKTPCVLHFDQVTAAIVVKIQNCEVGLLFHQKYTVEY